MSNRRGKATTLAIDLMFNKSKLLNLASMYTCFPDGFTAKYNHEHCKLHIESSWCTCGSEETLSPLRLARHIKRNPGYNYCKYTCQVHPAWD